MSFFNDQNVSDSDGRAGNSEYSPEYSRVYLRDGLTEGTTYEDTDWHNVIQAQQYELELEKRLKAGQYDDLLSESRDHDFIRGLRSESAGALSRLHLLPEAGKFVVPNTPNSFAAHLAMVRAADKFGIQFKPREYVYFDKVIADSANRPDIFDPKHPEYKDNIAIRENLAVLRNDLMNHYFSGSKEDSSVDAGEKQHLTSMVQIASEIGDAMNAGKNWNRAVYPSIDSSVANIEGEGAAYIYEFLLRRQVSDTPMGNAWASVRRFMGMPDHQWQLPALELTAYSQVALDALPPIDPALKANADDIRQRIAEKTEQLRQITDPTDVQTVAALALRERREAVNHGKTILEWLKNIKFNSKDLEDVLDAGRPETKLSNAQLQERNHDAVKIAMILQTYSPLMESIKQHESLQHDPKVKAADEVLDVLKHTVEIMAKLERARGGEDAMDISADLANQPERWKELSKQDLKKLIQILREGLEEAVQKMEAEQNDMQLAQEAFASQQVEEALAMQRGKGKKRKGMTDAQRVSLALSADDRAAGQGRFSGDDNEDAVRIARQKVKQQGDEQFKQVARMKDKGDNTSNANRDAGEDISMEEQIAQAKALGKDLGGKNVGAKMPADNDLVKQLGRNLMHMQQQANVAASEIADVKGGGIGTGENHADRQDPKTNLKNNRPQIG